MLCFFGHSNLKLTSYMKYSIIFKALFLAATLVFISSCKDDPQRHLELGEWYAKKGLVEEAILEFKEVTRLYPASLNNLNREDYQSLSKAHYNLSLMYTKKGWWDYALKEAEICFQMQPTKSNYELVKLIKQRANLENPG